MPDPDTLQLELATFCGKQKASYNWPRCANSSKNAALGRTKSVASERLGATDRTPANSDCTHWVSITAHCPLPTATTNSTAASHVDTIFPTAVL